MLRTDPSENLPGASFTSGENVRRNESQWKIVKNVFLDLIPRVFRSIATLIRILSDVTRASAEANAVG
jgi:hypothetical protein